jgi:hypothetical protein
MKRTKILGIKLSDSEHTLIKAVASHYGLSMSMYFRSLLMNKVNADAISINKEVDEIERLEKREKAQAELKRMGYRS